MATRAENIQYIKDSTWQASPDETSMPPDLLEKWRAGRLPTEIHGAMMVIAPSLPLDEYSDEQLEMMAQSLREAKSRLSEHERSNDSS